MQCIAKQRKNMELSKYYLNPEPVRALEWYAGLDYEGRRNARGFMSVVFCSDYNNLKKYFNFLERKGYKDAAGWLALYASYNPKIYKTIPTAYQKMKFCLLVVGMFFLKWMIGHKSMFWRIGDAPRSPQEIDMNFAAFSGTGETDYLAANLFEAERILNKKKIYDNDALILSCLTWAFSSLAQQDTVIKAYLERSSKLFYPRFFKFVLEKAEKDGLKIDLGKID